MALTDIQKMEIQQLMEIAHGRDGTLNVVLDNFDDSTRETRIEAILVEYRKIQYERYQINAEGYKESTENIKANLREQIYLVLGLYSIDDYLYITRA